MRVNLEDVIESIEFENESLKHYYNKEEEIIIYIEDELTQAYNASDLERIEEFEDWERELIQTLYHFRENPDKYIQLPTKEEMNEEGMMIEFLLSLDDFTLKRDELENYSVRQLMEVIKEKGQITQWYDFREDTEQIIAKSWCNKNKIEY